MAEQKIPFYYLKSCDKCVKILKSLPGEKLDTINIKETPLNQEQVDELKNIVGSYRELFNFRAQKLKEINVKPETEEDFRKLLLEDYTFLKRPIAKLQDKIVSGNKPEDFLELRKALEKE